MEDRDGNHCQVRTSITCTALGSIICLYHKCIFISIYIYIYEVKYERYIISFLRIRKRYTAADLMK